MEKSRSLSFQCGYVNLINFLLIALHFYISFVSLKYYKDDKIEFLHG
jgi:hypothetical protein